MKLPKGVKEAFEEFDDAAQRHGWEADQGWGGSPERAKERYEKAKAALFEEINKMRQNDRRREG